MNFHFVATRKSSIISLLSAVALIVSFFTPRGNFGAAAVWLMLAALCNCKAVLESPVTLPGADKIILNIITKKVSRMVYAVGTKTQGTGGFEWFWNKEDADAYFEQETKDAAELKAKGQRWDVFRFEHTTDLTEGDAITAEIDARLFEYEEAAGIE